MSDQKFYTQLDLGKSLQPLPCTKYATTTDNNHFQATITPPFGTFGDFKATQHTYRSFTPDTISIIGRRTNGATLDQLHIFIPATLKNGKYRIEDSSGISVGFVTGGFLYEGVKGKLSIEQNGDKTFVEANFDYEILHLGNKHIVNGKLALQATEFL